MPIILRLDVDNPYPLEPLPWHILSKIRQDFYFPSLNSLGYLRGLKHLIKILNEKRRKAYFFFRKCTHPTKEIIDMLNEGDHEIGIHIENSRDLKFFEEEVEYFRSAFGDKIVSFSKHGSGKWKGGRKHYPEYEPEKYLNWATTLNLSFFSGNGAMPDRRVALAENDIEFYSDAYWLEVAYRDTSKYDITWLSDYAENKDVVVATHPEQWARNIKIKEEFHEILNLPDVLFKY